MSNSLDLDQARRFVGPDLGPNCLPRLTADDTGRQRVEDFFCYLISVKAAGFLCVLGISFGIGSYVLYKIYDRYIKPVFCPRRRSSSVSEDDETDEEADLVCWFTLL